MIKKALIFAAGKGTRLKPFTDHHPKALALVNGVSLLERNILYLKSFGIKEIVINIHHFGEQIIDFIENKENFGLQISFSDESSKLLETGGGLLFAKEFLKTEEHFLIINTDILTDLNLIPLMEFHIKQKSLVTLAVSQRETSRKLLFDENMMLKGWINKNTLEYKPQDITSKYTEFAFSGIHCVSNSIFDIINRKGAFSIIEEYLSIMKNYTIKGFFHNARLIDVGKQENISIAEIHFR